MHKDSYQKAGKKSPAWDAAAQRLFEAATTSHAFAHAGSLWTNSDIPTGKEIRALAETVRNAGCNDPWYSCSTPKTCPQRNGMPSCKRPPGTCWPTCSLAFIEPLQGAVIEEILRHCGLRQPSRAPPRSDGRRAPPAGIGWAHAPDDEPPELTYVDIDTFEAAF